jgi:hypothetical protein
VELKILQPLRLLRQSIHSQRKTLESRAILRLRQSRKLTRGLSLQRSTNDVVALDIVTAGNANSCPGSRTALKEPLQFKLVRNPFIDELMNRWLSAWSGFRKE